MKPALSDVGESVAELMHDLRGPLMAIGGWADLMSLESDADRRRTMFEEIAGQVDQLTELSTATLAFARGEQPILPRQEHLYAFAQTLEQHLAQEFHGTGIASTVLARYTGPARFDRTALLRVVDNLAHNAHQAMRDGHGSHFDVRIEARDTDLVLEFIDDGPGFDPHMRNVAFTPFATWGKSDGHGLGLATVKRIVEDHHGHVALRDSAAGACIVVRLPLDPQDKTP